MRRPALDDLFDRRPTRDRTRSGCLNPVLSATCRVGEMRRLSSKHDRPEFRFVDRVERRASKIAPLRTCDLPRFVRHSVRRIPASLPFQCDMSLASMVIEPRLSVLLYNDLDGLWSCARILPPQPSKQPTFRFGRRKSTAGAWIASAGVAPPSGNAAPAIQNLAQVAIVTHPPRRPVMSTSPGQAGGVLTPAATGAAGRRSAR